MADDLDELMADSAADDQRAAANRAAGGKVFHAAGDTNLFGGNFTPFKDIWNAVASDLGITTKRMRNDALATAAHEEEIRRDTSGAISGELERMRTASTNPQDLAQLRTMQTQLGVATRLQQSANPKFQEAGTNLLAKITDAQRAFQEQQEVQKIAADVHEETMRQAVGDETWSRFSGLRDDYRVESQPFQTRKQAWDVMQTAALHPDHGGDVARTNAFMHMIEPNSVVMPGEAANVAGLGGVPDILVTAISKVMNEGGTYTPEQRKELDSFARDLMVNANKDQSERNARYAGQARSGKVPADWMTDLLVEPADTSRATENFGASPFAPPPAAPAGAGPSQTDSTARQIGDSTREGVKTALGGAVDLIGGLIGAKPATPAEPEPKTPAERRARRQAIEARSGGASVSGVIRRPVND